MEVLKLETWINEFSPQELVPDEVQKYLDFVVQAVDRYDPSRYSECHHVMPKCIDKNHTYDSQKVRVNGRDHFLAHKMLVDCFEGDLKRKLSWALHGMTRGLRSNDLVPEDYEESRKALSEASRGRVVSELTRKKISLSHSGKKLSNETRYRMSVSQKIRMNRGDYPSKGRIASPEERKRLSDSHRGILHTDQRKKDQSERMKGNSFAEGMVWITNGNEERLVRIESTFLDPGWRLGRKGVSDETRLRLSQSHPRSYGKREYHLTCKKCNCSFIGNSSNQRYCTSCR